MALEAGYAEDGHALHKLYVRQCKCNLELGRIPAAQRSFDLAVDAIDRSGLSKELRQGLATELQEAFIKLAEEHEDNEEDEADKEGPDEKRLLPTWARINERHRSLPGASDAVEVQYDEEQGRHVLASRSVVVYTRRSVH